MMRYICLFVLSALLFGCHSDNKNTTPKKSAAYDAAANVQQTKHYKTLPPPNVYTNAYGGPPKNMPKDGAGFSQIAPTPFNDSISQKELKSLDSEELLPDSLGQRLPNKDIPGTPQNAIQKTLIHDGVDQD